MRTLGLLAALLCASLVMEPANGQFFKQSRASQDCPTCPYGSTCEGGVCSVPAIVTQQSGTNYDVRYPCGNHPLILDPLTQADAEDINITSLPTGTMEAAAAEDRFSRVVKATCRITVSGTCGSGTVVGRDSAGNALVLTNAHVAGTQRGRVVSVERWNPDGSSERGNGAIIASGYARGMSVDFALLKCNAGFAEGVTPIPLADRYPDVNAGVTTFGCPRCEWPSLQVLKLNRKEGQVLTWKPEAIGGRSGSSLVDYTDDGPRVVGLLTWGGGGEGLGQSTPFLLSAMRGAMPRNFEPLPSYAQEVASSEWRAARIDALGEAKAWTPANTDLPVGIKRMPCGANGDLLVAYAPQSSDVDGKTDSVTIDSIIEHGPDEPTDEGGIFGRRPRDREPGDSPTPRFLLGGIFEWLRRVAVSLAIAAGVGVFGYLVGRFWRS